jgi:hypothetical protein
MGALCVSVCAWFARLFAVLGLRSVVSLAFLAPLAPVFASIATAIGAVISAIFEIAASLSRSAEGRVVLGLTTAALGFFYLRFHYIEEGKAQAKLTYLQKPCVAVDPKRHKK